jgi:nitronate monooxygenase
VDQIEQVSLETPFTQLLGLKTPIVQAPMSELDLPELVAAVSNAGGLGVLGLSWTPPEEIKPQIAQIRTLTSRPFGINLILDWDEHERLTLALEAGVQVVFFSWGNPEPYLPLVREYKALSMLAVGSAAETAMAVEAGVDVIVAQGVEAGGHVLGTVGTMALLPVVVDAAKKTPVIAAGGIADGRGLAASLVLGASGVCCGTRFLASEEAYAHPEYKQRILKARETDTCYSVLFNVGWPNAPHRTLANRAVSAWEKAGRPASGERPHEGEQVGTMGDGSPITLYQEIPVCPDVEGDLEMLPLYAGESAGLIRSIKPAGMIVAEMTAQARTALTPPFPQDTVA